MTEHMMDELLNKLNRDNYFTEVQLEHIKYAMKLVAGDVSKFLLLITLAGSLGYGLEFLFAYITSLLLRVLIGGRHLDTYLGCLLFSLLYFSALIFLSSILSTQYYDYLFWMAIIFTVILIVIAPRISKKSGRSFKRNRVKIKLITLTLAAAYLILFLVKREPVYAIGPLTIIFQTLQLLTMKGGSYYEVRKEPKIHT